MRLILYLLALLSGFSAAEAARPVHANRAAVNAASIAAYQSFKAEQAQPATPLPIMLAASGERRLPLLLSNLPHQMAEPVTRTFESDRSRV
jgi:hypothetical protein